jgi:hypothetical protein
LKRTVWKLVELFLEMAVTRVVIELSAGKKMNIDSGNIGEDTAGWEAGRLQAAEYVN